MGICEAECLLEGGGGGGGGAATYLKPERKPLVIGEATLGNSLNFMKRLVDI